MRDTLVTSSVPGSWRPTTCHGRKNRGKRVTTGTVVRYDPLHTRHFAARISLTTARRVPDTLDSRRSTAPTPRRRHVERGLAHVAIRVNPTEATGRLSITSSRKKR